MNLISLDIRMLRSLISVVDTGSITETARRLGRTQPAISLQIQRLEDITGKVLFQHEGRRMALTPDGDMVLAYAKSILRLHDELLSRLSSPHMQRQARFRQRDERLEVFRWVCCLYMRSKMPFPTS